MTCRRVVSPVVRYCVVTGRWERYCKRCGRILVWDDGKWKHKPKKETP